ncbi:LysE family transporter [Actinoallomurus rhizosphaericola]|uniref:LysE family transporter n=1 Tax=Actinoallomurus rhizosphaericola TaxID=2952536 RepID=UPI002093D59F|nr:LysE family transporter [Actinoallomurus rhizosphaericola]MCO6000230.1 LysE family transporter [Actinoallomurus rhizosphaericola]
MIAALVAGLLAGYGIAVPVGAVAAYLIALTTRTSLTTGACAALGVATADGLYALVATVGGSAVAAVIRPVLVPLRWCSAVVLIVLAVRGLAGALARYRERLTPTRAGEAPIGPGRAYLGLLGITLLNPTTVVYFAALVLGGHGEVAADQTRRAVFVLAAFAASASWQLLLAGGGALLGRALTGARGRLGTALASSLVMTALAVHLLIA